MRHHILIPCGTSQIDPEKVRNLQLALPNDQVEAFLAQAKRPTLSADEFFNKYRKIAQHIVRALVDNQETLRDSHNADNLFGAEVSTLAALKHHGNWDTWNCKEDSYVILSSDTGPGYFCAQVLFSLLIDKDFWGIPDSQVREPVIVPFLIDRPSSEAAATEAMKNLVNVIRDHLILSKNPSKQLEHNVILMSGGYKSMIPYLTLFSLFYGIELVYLFEHSLFAQSLFPNIQFDQTEWMQWSAACNNLLKKNQHNTTIRLILEGRPANPEERF